MAEQQGSKRPVNLTLDSDVVAAARELGINLSQTCNQALVAAVKAEQQARWKAENSDAIHAWNRWYDQSGDPLAHLRQG